MSEGIRNTMNAVVLTGNSLLVQGFVSRLREHSRFINLCIIELNSPNLLNQIYAFQPDVIFFEKGDFKETLPPFLVDLLNSMPHVVLVELKLSSSSVHLIQSVEVPASNVDELVQLIGKQYDSIEI